MPSLVAVFPGFGYRRLVPRLLGQPRVVPCWSRGSLGLPYSSCLCSMPDDLPWAGRRSQLCGGASPGPVWLLPPCCPARRHSSIVRTPLCKPLCSSDSLCSSSYRSTSGTMSSSFSSTNDGQGIPKLGSPFHKRGSLQSTPSSGECGFERGPTERMSEL